MFELVWTFALFVVALVVFHWLLLTRWRNKSAEIRLQRKMRDA